MSTVTRIGLMGFGHMGREIYRLAQAREGLEIPVIVDVGEPAILHYLLQSESPRIENYQLKGLTLQGASFTSRMLQTDRPAEPPWDAFDVDCVIDTTRYFGLPLHVQNYLSNGAGRVLFSSLPLDPGAVEKILIPGINLRNASTSDRAICAGSPTTTALVLMLKVLDEAFGLQAAAASSVHAYTSDQPAQDYAGADSRRSRSAAENIIPNQMPAIGWVEQLLPELSGRITGFSMNVPVQHGSLLDVSATLSQAQIGVDAINQAFIEAAERLPAQLAVATDPIVSSDILGDTHSLLFDTKATLRAGQRTVKAVGWYETLGQASRTLELVQHYAWLDQKGARS